MRCQHSFCGCMVMFHEHLYTCMYNVMSEMMCIWHKSYTFALWIENRHVKVIFAVMKQLKQLQRKPRKKSEASTGFEPMTSAIPVRCSTNWAMKPRWKQVKSEFNLYTLYEENEMCIYDINHTQIWLNYYTCSSLNWIYTFSISDSELGNFVQQIYGLR